MEPDAMATNEDELEVLCHWSARKLHPIIVLYVALVFVAMMALSFFVFHSTTGLKALLLAAVGSIVPLLAEVLSRVEYRLTERGLERRPLAKKEPKDFTSVFQLDQLSHVVPIGHGFKFYKILNESNPLKRFWKAHLSDAYSGEVRVEAEDRQRVLDVLAQHGISSR